MKPLELIHLHKKYDDFHAVKGVHFELQAGEIFGLLGPNGAGKTTIISMITTLEKPTSGAVHVFGHDVQTEEFQAKKQLGVVHQEIINSGFFSVEEILRFQSGYYGLRKNQEHIEYVMGKLSLIEHRHKKVKQLSGGMKRRLMIAKALVHQPKLILLDEPTAGVDIELRQSLWEFVHELKKQGMTILLTTHYLEEAEQLCDRVGIIHKGEIQCVGETKEIVSRFTGKSVQLSLNSEKNIEHSFLTKKEKNHFQFYLPKNYELGTFLAELKIELTDILDLQIKEGSLEEAFVKIINKQGAAL